MAARLIPTRTDDNGGIQHESSQGTRRCSACQHDSNWSMETEEHCPAIELEWVHLESVIQKPFLAVLHACDPRLFCVAFFAAVGGKAVIGCEADVRM